MSRERWEWGALHVRTQPFSLCGCCSLSCPQPSSSQPGLPWLCPRLGTQQGRRHFIAASSLLSQAVPALLTPKAGSVGKLTLKGVTSTPWLPKLRITSSNPDRFSFAPLTSLIQGQMVKPCLFERGDSRLALHLLFVVLLSCLPPAWGPHVSDMSALRSVEWAPEGSEWEEDSGTGLLEGSQPHLRTLCPLLTASASLFLNPTPLHYIHTGPSTGGEEEIFRKK